MTIEEISRAVETAVRNNLDNGRIAEAVKETVKNALEEEGQRSEDPYRTTLHFLAGLLAAWVAVTAAVLSVFPVDADFAHTPAYRMVGGILAWSSVGTLASALSIGTVQIMKRNYRKDMRKWKVGQDPPRVSYWLLNLLIYGSAAFGLGPVYYCIRGGASIVTGESRLLSFWEALSKLVVL